ncbi:MAG: hypothetical protein IT304_04875 [Dehalococcoidia bacterium]|nr:hypothetical protein [Dehalococcoidia bacterium]
MPRTTDDRARSRLLERLEVARFDHDPERPDGRHDAECAPTEGVAVYTLDGEPVSDPDRFAEFEAALAEED